MNEIQNFWQTSCFSLNQSSLSNKLCLVAHNSISICDKPRMSIAALSYNGAISWEADHHQPQSCNSVEKNWMLVKNLLYKKNNDQIILIR